MEEKKFVIREDLNEIVKDMGFKKVKTNFGERIVFNVTFFNDEVVQFKDNENIYKMFQSFMRCGETDFIKSKKLVEELKLDDDGSIVGTYICVKYELKDDSNTVVRMFTTKYNDNTAINNYYKEYKLMQKKAEKKA